MLLASEHVFFYILCRLVLVSLGFTSCCISVFLDLTNADYQTIIAKLIALMENLKAHVAAEQTSAAQPVFPLNPEMSVNPPGCHLGQPYIERKISNSIKRKPLACPLTSVTTGSLGQDENTSSPLENPESLPEIDCSTDESILLDFDWQLFEIPLELRLVQLGTPGELCRVIREFWQQCEAMQASTRSLGDFASGAKALTATGAMAFTKESGYIESESEPTSATSTFSTSRSSVESMTTVGSDTPKATDSTASKGRLNSSGQDIPSKADGIRSLSTVISRLIKRRDCAKYGERDGDLMAIPLREPSKTKECASCFDDVPEGSSVDLSCKHSYCPECFSQHIITSMQNENLWPPRCCLQPIPRNSILRHLSKEQVLEFGTKEREYSTPAKDRWYCLQPTCTKWFEPNVGASWTQCPHCKFKMCSLCRGKTHSGTERCPQDRNLQATLEEAEMQGWRSCYNCNAIVELSSGCRHITCKCKAQFW